MCTSGTSSLLVRASKQQLWPQIFTGGAVLGPATLLPYQRANDLPEIPADPRHACPRRCSPPDVFPGAAKLKPKAQGPQH